MESSDILDTLFKYIFFFIIYAGLLSFLLLPLYFIKRPEKRKKNSKEALFIQRIFGSIALLSVFFYYWPILSAIYYAWIYEKPRYVRVDVKIENSFAGYWPEHQRLIKAASFSSVDRYICGQHTCSNWILDCKTGAYRPDRVISDCLGSVFFGPPQRKDFFWDRNEIIGEVTNLPLAPNSNGNVTLIFLAPYNMPYNTESISSVIKSLNMEISNHWASGNVSILTPDHWEATIILPPKHPLRFIPRPFETFPFPPPAPIEPTPSPFL